MNTHELPMILFTVIAQLSVGTFIAVGVMDLLLSHRNDARTVRRVTEPVTTVERLLKRERQRTSHE